MSCNQAYPFPTIPANLPDSYKGLGRASARYPYTNENGEITSLVLRFDNNDKSDKSRKEFRPYQPNTGEWKAPTVRPLYRLDLIATVSGRVVLVEGEKCADALNAIGILATTAFGGCNGVGKTDFTPLRDRDVIIWPDNDDAGLKYAEAASVTLRNVNANSIRNVNVTQFEPLPNGIDLRKPIPDPTPIEVESPIGDAAYPRSTPYRGESLIEDDIGTTPYKDSYPRGWDVADGILKVELLQLLILLLGRQQLLGLENI